MITRNIPVALYEVTDCGFHTHTVSVPLGQNVSISYFSNLLNIDEVEEYKLVGTCRKRFTMSEHDFIQHSNENVKGE